MEKALKATQQNFESSSQQTPEYRRWHHLFKRQLASFLLEYGITIFKPSKPNHFDFSAFFQTPNGQWYYVSISDVRGFKNDMLMRTADNEKDFQGGINCFVSLKSITDFRNDFESIVKLKT